MSFDQYKLRKLHELPFNHNKSRQFAIQRIMKTGMTRHQAEIHFEEGAVRGAGIVAGALAGGASLYFTRPLFRILNETSPLGRKPFIYYPLKLAVFAAGYQLSNTFRSTRVLGGWFNVSFEKATRNNDLLSGFRIYARDAERKKMSENTPQNTAFKEKSDSNPVNYLNQTETERQIKNYLIDHLPIQREGMEELFAERALHDPQIVKRLPQLKIRRVGKMRDQLFNTVGNIHGLENIALMSEEEFLKFQGDPIGLQQAIFRRSDEEQARLRQKPKYKDFKEALGEFQVQLAKYKKFIHSVGSYGSERKQMLALPFLLKRNEEKTLPQKGQWEADIFQEIYGHEIDYGKDEIIDEEKKLTEYDYEDYLPDYVIDDMGGVQAIANNEELRKKLRYKNIMTLTKMEQADSNRREFSTSVMPLLEVLNKRQAEDYVAVSMNRRSEDAELDRIIRLNNRSEEERLSKLSEEARYEEKAYQQLNYNTLQYQDKERVKVDEDRLQKSIINSSEFYTRVNNDLGTYPNVVPMKRSFESQLLKNFSRAKGLAGELSKELGIADQEALAINAPPTDMYEQEYIQQEQQSNAMGIFDAVKMLHGIIPIINNNEYEEHFISEHQFNRDYTDLPMEPQVQQVLQWPYECDWDDDTGIPEGYDSFADNPDNQVQAHNDWNGKSDFQKYLDGEEQPRHRSKLKIIRGSGVEELYEMTDKVEEFYSDFVEDIVRDDITAREFILPQIMKDNYHIGQSIYSPESKLPGDLIGVRKHPLDESEDQETEPKEIEEEDEEEEQEGEEEEEEEIDTRPNLMRAISWAGGKDYGKDRSGIVKEVMRQMGRDDNDEYDELRPGIHRYEDLTPHMFSGNRFFKQNEKIQHRFHESEIEAFLKAIDIRTVVRTWRDMSEPHPRAAIHYYDDIAQEWDYMYHAINDQEWKGMLETKTRKWRQGPIVRFRMGKKDKRVFHE